ANDLARLPAILATLSRNLYVKINLLNLTTCFYNQFILQLSSLRTSRNSLRSQNQPYLNWIGASMKVTGKVILVIIAMYGTACRDDAASSSVPTETIAEVLAPAPSGTRSASIIDTEPLPIDALRQGEFTEPDDIYIIAPPFES